MTDRSGDRNKLWHSLTVNEWRQDQHSDLVLRVVGWYAEYKDEQEDTLDGDWECGFLKYLKILGHSTSRILLSFHM